MKENREAIYGRQSVYEVLTADRRKVFRLFKAKRIKQSTIFDSILTMARNKSVHIHDVGDHELRNMSNDGNHQGVVIEVSPYPYMNITDLIFFSLAQEEEPFLILLDELQDPQNLGSILRSAEIFGAHGVVLLKHRSATVTPSVVRTSAGASEQMNIAIAGNLVNVMRELKDHFFTIIGMEGNTEESYYESDMSGSVAIVLGSEGKGLRRLVRETCDKLVKIPMSGKIDSLNVGAAGAVVFAEVRRQRTSKH